MNDSNATSKFLQKHSDFGLKTLSKFLPIAIVIVLANGLVFVLFYRCRRLRTSSNYVLLSLAICDFSIGAIAIPYFIVHNFGISPPQMDDGVYASHTLLAISGAYHILFITGLKYMATVSPLKHHVVTKSLVLKIVLGVWITSTVFAIIPVVFEYCRSICTLGSYSYCSFPCYGVPFPVHIYDLCIHSHVQCNY